MAKDVIYPNLTDLQRKWLVAYLGEANFNATEAARIAGYGGGYFGQANRGMELVKNSEIQAYIRQAFKERGMMPEEVIGRMSDLARSSLDDVLKIDDETGTIFTDLRIAKRRGKMHTIKSFRRSKAGVSVEMHSALDALEKLAKIHRMYADDETEREVNQINVFLGLLPPELAAGLRKRLAFPVLPEVPDTGSGDGS